MLSARTLFSTSLLALGALYPCFAQSTIEQKPQPHPLFALPERPAIVAATAQTFSVRDSAPPAAPTTSALVAAFRPRDHEDATYHPFLSYSVSLRLGLGGIGGDLTTPLSHRLALRTGAEAFSYSTTFTTNGLKADGSLKLGDSFTTLDLHPFRNGFRLSPGVTLYNRNNVSANLNVPGGGSFTLNSVDYTSEASDPITGNAAVTFGHKVAPRFTLGWGNSFPRHGGHWTFPFELGFYYTSYPTIAINLSGSACSSDGCGSINTPANQANIHGEEVKLNNDIAPARFFPVLSFGVGYRFGR